MIVEGVRGGLSLSRAGILAGISDKTACEWRAEKPEFAEQIARAESEFVQARLLAIREGVTAKGDHDWKTDAWLLERRFREEFGQQKTDVSVSVGVAITISEPERQALLERRRLALSSGGVN